jgi:hypothetical protein
MADPAAEIEADGVRVVFFRAGDRYAHRVEAFDAVRGEWVAVWESLEGAADDVWPASPPLQQLHVEERPEGRVALLVGMAGRTHWSAAVEAARGESGGKSIRFDVAARVPAGLFMPGAGRLVPAAGGPVPAVGGRERLAPPRLGSAYRIYSVETGARIGLLPLEGAEFAQVELGGEEQCVVRPAPPSAANDDARTIAWRYTIERLKVFD